MNEAARGGAGHAARIIRGDNTFHPSGSMAVQNLPKAGVAARNYSSGHIRHVLLSHMKYNEMRTHLTMEKDAPVLRAVERTGHILCRLVLGGLHHRHVRT